MPAKKEAPLAQPAAKKSAVKKPAKAPKQLPKLDLSRLDVRCIGPARMGGRVIDLAVNEAKPSTYWVATASGGLWKTVNGGVTFTPQFDQERCVSIGDVELAPSDPKIVWVGTGEANNRNSTSWGNGVYKSVDGGKSWKHMGLPKSYHIGAIAIHPKNPDIVFVAACGDLWAPNPERGLYRTKDGGTTWNLVLKRDQFTGATEVRIDPSDPNTVYAALYERQRDGFDTNAPKKRWGPGSGLFKSSDGGDTWRKLTKGLPSVKMGRIALDIYRQDPKVLFALIETELIGTLPKGASKPKPKKAGPAFMGINSADAVDGAELLNVTRGGPAAQAGLQRGDVVVKMADKPVTSSDELIAGIRSHRSGDKVEVIVRRGEAQKKLSLTFGSRQRAGAAGRSPVAGRLHGQIANRVKLQGPNGYQTGGTYRSDDGGESWRRINSLNPRPYYFSRIRVDPHNDQHLFVCGVSFYASKDGGKSFASGNAARGVHVDHHALWINPKDGRHMILGGDGGVHVTWDRGKAWQTFSNFAIGQAYHANADTRRPYWVYAGYQDNGSWGSPSESHYHEGLTNYDAFKIGGGDGFTCRIDRDDPNIVFGESQGGSMYWRNVMTGQRGGVRRVPMVLGEDSPRRARGSTRLRWNWNTPFLLSHYNQRKIYYAGSRVFQSPNRGRNAWVISPEITLTDRGSATALDESKLQPGLLWVGSDDGAVHVTTDEGRKWTAVHSRIMALLPGKRPMWVSHIAASAHSAKRAYLSLDGHRLGDKNAYVFVTEDLGQTWRSISKGLPADSVHCIHEDARNADLLYVGTEMGLWISMDRGATWQELPKPFPTVAVHDLDQQNREEHLIIATHGRSLWVLDIRPLRRLTKVNRAKSLYLVQPNDVLRLRKRRRTLQGSAHFRLPNPPERAEIYYWLGKDQKLPVQFEIHNAAGELVYQAKIKGKAKGKAGLHRFDWPLLVQRAPAPPAQGRRRPAPRAPAGQYAITMTVGKTRITRTMQIEDDPRPLDTAVPRGPRVFEGRSAVEQAEMDAEFELHFGDDTKI